MDKNFVLIIKAVCWRIVGTVDTFLVAWIVTGEPAIAVSISAVEFFTKIMLYWLHERAWLGVLRRL
jgi:uncharacterized membrane protein